MEYKRGNVVEKLQQGDKLKFKGYEDDTYEVISTTDDAGVTLERNSSILVLSKQYVDCETIEVNGILVNSSEEITNTSRYRTQSGKQLYDVLGDDLLTPEEFRGSCKKDIYKYVFRYKEKGGIASLEKAKATIDVLIAYEKELGDID